MHENIKQCLEACFTEDLLIAATISSPLDKNVSSKITIKSVLVKNSLSYQISELDKKQAFHQILEPNKTSEFLVKTIPHYKQAVLFTSHADYHILNSRKGHTTILRKKPTKQSIEQFHNRPKTYILNEGTPISFLVKLGIMDAQGKVYPKMMHKFKQINRFVELIADIVPQLDKTKRINIIDFGSGKAYLTFALYYYLKNILGLSIHIQGLDLKKSVVEDCQKLAEELGYVDLKFAFEDINNYIPSEPIQMVVSLHACDTATDAALAKAIEYKAEVIFCVPCCQHELFNQIDNEHLTPLLKHGILKERFAALATDAARAQILEIQGYQAKVMEFIDLEHTPKNLLIRAVKKSKKGNSDKLLEQYKHFSKILSIKPTLEKILNAEFM